MKKVLMVFIICSVLFVSFASERTFGYGVSVSGNTQSINDVNVSLFYRPFAFDYMNPFVRAEGGIRGFKTYVGCELLRTSKNLLQFTTVNFSKYSPSAGFGASYKNKSLYLYFELAPFRVIEKDFLSEYLTLAYEYLPEINDSIFTVYLFRFTAML